MKIAISIVLFLMMIVGAYLSITSSIDYANLKEDLKTKYIDKSQCIRLPSSDVNYYWACKKEVKK